MSSSRKKEVIAIVSVLLVAGFLITSLSSFFVSRASLRTQITHTELPLTSDNIYSEIQRDLLRPIFISSLMANDTFLRDWVIEGERDMVKVTRYLNEIQTKYGTFTSFFVSERTHTYYQSKGILKKVSQDDERDQWYFRVRQLKTDYEINVDPDMANRDAMTIFINYRVYDYNNRYIGATGVGLTVSAVKQLIQTYQQNYGRSIYFADKNGVIKLQSSNAHGSPTNIHNIEGLTDIASSVLSGIEHKFTYKRQGKTVYLNTRYIPEFEWYLMVEQTDAAATQNIVNTLILNLAICGIITTIILFLVNLTIATYQSKLEEMATTDKLTGLYNRHTFDVILEESAKDAKRRQRPFSVLLIDIDEFKLVNDTHGHLAGDAVIMHIAGLIRKNLRESDVVCRWGGEEFLVLLKGCDIDDAFQGAEKIRGAISTLPTNYKNLKIAVTISIGVTDYQMNESTDNLLRRVDDAMYAAKKQGRNITVRG